MRRAERWYDAAFAWVDAKSWRTLAFMVVLLALVVFVGPLFKFWP